MKSCLVDTGIVYALFTLRRLPCPQMLKIKRELPLVMMPLTTRLKYCRGIYRRAARTNTLSHSMRAECLPPRLFSRCNLEQFDALRKVRQQARRRQRPGGVEKPHAPAVVANPHLFGTGFEVERDLGFDLVRVV